MKNVNHHDQQKVLGEITRRYFIKQGLLGFGSLALGSLVGGCNFLPKKVAETAFPTDPMLPKAAHFVPKAKRVIFMHMAGAPSHLELFDYKPELQKIDGKDCPQSFLEGKRFAFIRGVPKMLGAQAEFKQHGQSGAWISNHMPHLAEVADDICFLKAMHTNEFNHAPAQLLLHTGSSRLGRPGLGAWATYGLGSENDNLPGYMVLASGGKNPDGGKSLWGSGFLPSVYQGVQCRDEGDPILYVSDPHGMDRDLKNDVISAVKEINQAHYNTTQDPETLTRIAQYEMAFRMQISVPEAMDISKEPAYIHEMYGTEPGKSSFANNCLLARRMIERGVRFVQLFHWGWDAHGTSESDSITVGHVQRCVETDKPAAALIKDLKQRGLLDDTLVVWSGEFGRTPMQEGGLRVTNFKGRDHHLEAFTSWVAGGGVKGGISYGETDEFGYYGVKDKVHVHDLQATILHLLGFDHLKFTYHFQGRDYRLTDVAGNVVKAILA